uniref:Tyrosine-protein phosphatase domain-containing protein n=1 Tax=Macrostomum lignano TaxID=282301 RepID=A0A1I8JR45_9PLAT
RGRRRVAGRVALQSAGRLCGLRVAAGPPLQLALDLRECAFAAEPEGACIARSTNAGGLADLGAAAPPWSVWRQPDRLCVTRDSNELRRSQRSPSRQIRGRPHRPVPALLLCRLLLWAALSGAGATCGGMSAEAALRQRKRRGRSAYRRGSGPTATVLRLAAAAATCRCGSAGPSTESAATRAGVKRVHGAPAAGSGLLRHPASGPSRDEGSSAATRRLWTAIRAAAPMCPPSMMLTRTRRELRCTLGAVSRSETIETMTGDTSRWRAFLSLLANCAITSHQMLRRWMSRLWPALDFCGLVKLVSVIDYRNQRPGLQGQSRLSGAIDSYPASALGQSQQLHFGAVSADSANAFNNDLIKGVYRSRRNRHRGGHRQARPLLLLYLKSCWQRGHRSPSANHGLLEIACIAELANCRLSSVSPILVCSRCGVFCVLHMSMDKMRYEGEIDIFRAVEKVRRNRPQLIDSLVEKREYVAFLNGAKIVSAALKWRQIEYQLCYSVMQLLVEYFFAGRVEILEDQTMRLVDLSNFPVT